MQEFVRKFIQLNGVKAKVIIEHCLFGNQRFYCSELQTINDNERVGVVLKGQEKFMYKQDVRVAEINNGVYMISDGRLKIQIITNKLEKI